MYVGKGTLRGVALGRPWRVAPARAGEPGAKRAEVAGGDHDDAAGIEVAVAWGERLARVRQVLDNIGPDDDIHMTDAAQVALVPPRLAARCCELPRSATD